MESKTILWTDVPLKNVRLCYQGTQQSSFEMFADSALSSLNEKHSQTYQQLCVNNISTKAPWIMLH